MDDDDNDTNTVHQAIKSIVAHYSQEIHLNNNSSDGNENIEVPYFDPLLGKPHDKPMPFMDRWIDALLQCCQKETDKSDDNDRINSLLLHQKYIKIYADLVHSYVLHVRSNCFQFVSTKQKKNSQIYHSVPIKIRMKSKNVHLILIHYEMMIQRFVKAMSSKVATTCDKIQSSNKHKDEGDDEEQQNAPSDHSINILMQSNIELIHSTVKVLVHDIIRLTCIKITNHHHHLQNWILPILLRIVQYSIQLLHDIIRIQNLYHLKLIANSSQETESDAKNSINAIIQSCLSYGLIAASSFATGVSKSMVSSDLDIFEILPMSSKEWKGQFTLRHMMETCAYSPSQLSPSSLLSSINENEKSIVDYGDYFMKLLNHVESTSTIKSTTDTDEYDSTLPTTFPASLQQVLNESMINFDSSTSGTLKMPWLDNKKGVGFRSGRLLLHQIELLAVEFLELIQNKIVTNNDMNVFDTILAATDIPMTTEFIRANFFGRLDDSFLEDDENNYDEDQYDDFMKKIDIGMDKLAFNGIFIAESSDEKKQIGDEEIHQTRAIKHLAKQKHGQVTQRRMNNFNRVDSGMPLDEEKPFHQVPARIVSSVRLLSSIKFPQVSTLVWSHALPIIYSLIDSNDASHQSIGGALFLHLLTESTLTSFLTSGDSYYDKKQMKRNNVIDPTSNFESAVHILSMAIRSCDDAVSLTILSSVRCRLFEMTERSTVPQVGRLRRISVTETMTWMKQRSYCGPSGDTKLVSLVKANLIDLHSLLAQIALQENADGMELGSLGLSTLLPLIRWNSSTLVGRTVQFTAVCCLDSLMMGAYPIMGKHGGKIMSELISCVGRGLRDLKISDDIQKKLFQGRSRTDSDSIREHSVLIGLSAFAIHVASVSLILCGKSAEDVLCQLEKGNYMQELVDCCALIRRGSLEMIENENKS